jgi:hypothetical protein
MRTFFTFPPKPETCELFYNNYGYEKPEKLGNWDWSSTFNQWGRYVEFSDGWKGFTFPKEKTGGLIENSF